MISLSCLRVICYFLSNFSNRWEMEEEEENPL